VTPWRDGWDPTDPRRPCWTCGSPPSSSYPDGSPSYTCWRTSGVPHVAVTMTPEEARGLARSPVGTLSPAEWQRSLDRAERVVRIAEEAGSRPYFVPPGESLVDVTARGHAAEVVASRVTGLEHHDEVLSIQELRRGGKRPDIGRRVQVRCVRNPLAGLPVYAPDPLEHLALLVTGRERGPYRIIGWIEVQDARAVGKRTKRGRMETWLVAQSALLRLPLPADA